MNYKILALSYLFPNKYNPFYGIFVLNRLNAVHKYCEVKVVAPIPWFPFMEKFRKFKNYTRIPKHEITEELEVYHPKFLCILICSILFLNYSNDYEFLIFQVVVLKKYFLYSNASL